MQVNFTELIEKKNFKVVRDNNIDKWPAVHLEAPFTLDYAAEILMMINKTTFLYSQ